jgi:hypothetical protein
VVRRRRRPLDHSVALFGTHLTPLFAQFLTPLGRHLPKAVERFPQALLLLRGQTLVLLPSLP